MKTDVELIQAMDRLKRAQPQNVDLLNVCEALQAEIVARRAAIPPPAASERKSKRART